MRQATHQLTVRTQGKGLYDITGQVEQWVDRQDLSAGLLTLFIQHTSASLTIQENASPDVLMDLNAHFDRMVPEERGLYRHTLEGPDDMPAHIRTVIGGVQLTIPIVQGALALGDWQGIYVFEHRRQPHERVIALHVLGE